MALGVDDPVLRVADCIGLLSLEPAPYRKCTDNLCISYKFL